MSASCAYDYPLGQRGKIIYMLTSAFSASLSILGSSLIIWIILRGRLKLSRPRNRLLFCRSIIDISFSTALGLSLLVIPQETVCSIGMGNLSTCNAQGFFIQVGFAIQAYTAMVSIYYLLTIRYGINHRTVAQIYEPFMHTYALAPPITTAIIGAANNMFFNETVPCWIGDICRSLGDCPEGNIWGRGLWIVLASAVYNLVNFIIVIYCMLALYFTLRKRSVAMKNFRFRPSSVHTVQNSQPSEMSFAAKEALKQTSSHLLANILIYMWIAIAIISSFINNGALFLPAWYQILEASFQPLLGFFNFVIYLQPMVSIARREENDNSISFVTVLNRIVTGTQNDPRDRNRFRHQSVYTEHVDDIVTNDDSTPNIPYEQAEA